METPTPYLTIAIVFILGFVAVGLVAWFVMIFNGLVALKNDAKKAWSDIDVILKQRYEELPNVIAAVKGYMAHEKGVLEGVTEARAKYLAAPDIHGKLEAERMLAGPLKTVFAVAENYPDLKANQNFLQLQQRISGLEIEISDRRELYNAAVNSFNTRIESLPDVFVARMLAMRPMELFAATAAEKAVPDVGAMLPPAA